MPADDNAAPADWLRPDWTAPGVGALMTTRAGGVGQGAYASMNLREGLGDDDAVVAHNRARLERAIGARPVRLNQVHGARVVRLGAADALPGAPVHEADAAISTEPGIACMVQVADCLPVLLAAPDARGVGAAHAGWRGLAGGVVERTLEALCTAARCDPGDVQAWLGPCIGPRRFEVGADVLAAFGVDPIASESSRFKPHAPGKWLADLIGLAHDRLAAARVRAVSGGRWCTVEDPSRFFSFRRDRVTGRMAAAVWLERLG
jgi:YfiH family protein